MNKQKIKLNLDNNLLTTLKDSFTSTRGVFSELMQNALRAKATEVRFQLIRSPYKGKQMDLIIEDNGIGIADFQNLLSIGKSGWDDKTKKRTSPYGVGFLSAISFCERISITSQGSKMTADTKDILSMNDINIESADDAINGVLSGAQIHLQGVQIGLDAVGDIIRDLAMGFPIKVFFNDAEQERPDDINADGAVDCANVDGSIFYINGMHNDKKITRNTVLYLQGLPVGIISSNGSVRKTTTEHVGLFGGNLGNNILHLNPEKYRARMPDREVLLDSKAIHMIIHDAFKNLWNEFFSNKKEELSEEDFVKDYWDIIFGTFCHPETRKYSFKALFNDINYIPQSMFGTITKYPALNYCGDIEVNSSSLRYRASYPNDEKSFLISKDEILNNTVNIFEIEDMNGWDSHADVDNCAVAYMYLFASEELNYLAERNEISELSNDHWLLTEGLIQTVVTGRTDSADSIDKHFKITLNGDVKRDYFSLGEWVNFQTFFVDSATIEHRLTGKSIDINDYAFLDPHNGVIVPAGENSGEVVRQVSNYTSEPGNYEHDIAEDDCLKFSRHIRVVRHNDPVKVLMEILGDANLQTYHDLFKEKTFTFEVNSKGEVIEASELV